MEASPYFVRAGATVAVTVFSLEGELSGFQGILLVRYGAGTFACRLQWGPAGIRV